MFFTSFIHTITNARVTYQGLTVIPSEIRREKLPQETFPQKHSRHPLIIHRLYLHEQ